MRNVTPCVSIVSCLKFVRLNAQFIRFYNPFVIVNAQKEAIMIHEKTFVGLNALCLSSKFTKVHLILQFTFFCALTLYYGEVRSFTDEYGEVRMGTE